MEFCPHLSAFQGVIISADNVHPFSRLTSRGGNEEKIQYVIDSLNKFLEDGQFCSKDGLFAESIPKIRKFAFFIILNSDLSVLSDMTDMEEIELVIWTIPTIPKCLMCEIFWRLNFKKFVYEVIAYSDPDLATEIASAFLDNIKYYTPQECLDKISTIGSAIYKLICRLYFFNFYSNTLTDKLTILFNHFQKALNFFTEPPKQERLNSLNKDDQYKYIGKCVNTMLVLVNQCIEEFLSTQEVDRISDPLYKLTYIGSVTRNVGMKPCDCPSPEILDCINKCHTALLDKFQELVMRVSVDIFCAWSEFELNGISTQRVIGELCYKVRTKLLTVSSVAEHPVVAMIQQISCKPEELSDMIKNADTDTIIQNVHSSEDKGPLVKALLEREHLYQDETLINCVADNIQLLNEEECYNLYKSLKNFMYLEYIEGFITKLFPHCNATAKLEILDDIFCNNCFVNMTETDEYSNMLTETFNKLIAAPDADLTDILWLFYQNPQKVYEKIFNLAAENEQQTSIMLKAMKLLEKFSNHYYSSDTEPCIIRITQNAFEHLDSDAKKLNFISFICALKNTESITGTKLLLLIIMPRIHKALLNKDIESLNVQCRLLNKAFTLQELVAYRAPMLAMFGQILDTVRWKIITFVALAPETLQLTLELQLSLFNTYDSGIPDNECSWLKNKLRNLKPLNMFYYRKIWNQQGENFVEVVSGIPIRSDMQVESLITWLFQVICSSTQQEWCNIWDCLAELGDEKTIDLFHHALSLVTLAEKRYRSDNTWNCVLYCYRNFIYIIRYKYFKEPLNDTQVSNVVEKIVVSSNLVSEDNTQELSTVLMPLFAFLAEKKSEYSFDITQHLTANLRQSQFADILTKVFSNGDV